VPAIVAAIIIISKFSKGVKLGRRIKNETPYNSPRISKFSSRRIFGKG
jgi:hypothetical protein